MTNLKMKSKQIYKIKFTKWVEIHPLFSILYFMIMLVSDIFDLLQKKYSAEKTQVIGNSVVYRMDLMMNFHIDFSFKWSTCTIELFSTNSKYGSHTTYFSSQYWINEDGFDKKLEDTISEYIETAKNIVEKEKLDKIKEDLV